MSGIHQLLFGGSVQQAVDPYFYSVTSLLHGDGTNGGQNNTFLDSSTNNFTITRNGNTTQGSFSPFSQTGWGVYQPSTASDYVNFTTSAGTLFQFTGDYTIETWVFSTVLGSDTSIWITNDGSANYHALNIDATNYNVYLNSGSPTSSISHGLQLNQWNHVAMVRNGSTITLYTNGVARGTITNSSTNGYSSPALARIGGGVAGSSRYLSNLRIVKGTAVYTAAFTPPTTPLTAISGTSLLTCQANRFLDASSNALVPTVTGSPSVQPFSPFNPTTPYSTSSIGGSGYFDGSGDYLYAAANAAFNFGAPSGNTNDFTVEMWVYPLNFSNIYFLYGTGPSGGADQFYLNTDGRAYYFDGTSQVSSPVLTANSWNHLALVRNGSGSNNIRVYGNGVSGTAVTSSNSLGSSVNSPYIGSRSDGSYPLPGYISSLRVVKGTAVYTANFTPPTAPLTAITNTSLLTNYTNAGIFDNAAVADYETVGNAQISTSVKKYGTGSMAFDGTGDWLAAPPTAQSDLGSGNFTIECWLYRTASGATFDSGIVSRGAPSTSNGFVFAYTSSNVLTFGFNYAGAIVSGSTAIPINTWTHVAVCRIGTTFKLFVNGNVDGTATSSSSQTLNASDVFYIGRSSFDSGRIVTGYIDDLRISKGVARYPYNFTPPTAEFPNIGGTVTLTADPYFYYTTLLLPGHGTNGAQNNTFLDSSTNAFSITRNGNTTQGTFSPFSQTGWGNFFSSTDALYNTSAPLVSASASTFTAEAWVYLTATPSNASYPSMGTVVTLNGQKTAAPVYLTFGITTSNTLSLYWFDGAAKACISSGTIPLNQWTHIAVSVNSNAITLYINGTPQTLTGTTTLTTRNGTVNEFAVGGNYYSTTPGYISNVRVTNTAVYSATFTPSTTPLTAISGTLLLTAQSNRFVDNSTNAYAFTVSGSPSVQAFSPLNPTTAWSAATYGGSGYFDGSGDYLTVADNAALQMGSGDFTIEYWWYPNNITSYQNPIDKGYSGSGAFLLQTGNGDGRILVIASGSIVITSSTAVTVNAWNHMAVVRSGTTLTLYQNGVSVGSATNSTNFNSTAPLGIGATATAPGGGGVGSWPVVGFLSGVRFVKGTAVYSGSTYTVPTAPLTAITNTSLLTNFTNAGIYDATSKNDLETVGNAQISTTQSKFGGSSMLFDGTGDWLALPASQNFAFGTGDFTIEGWLYASALGSVNAHGVFQQGTSLFPASVSNSLALGVNPSGTLVIYAKNTNTNSTTTVSTGLWVHFALVRFGTTTVLYANGTAVITVTSDSTNYTGTFFGVGSIFGTSGTNWNGYIDDLRITKGIARYTSNFIPPTTAFLTL